MKSHLYVLLCALVFFTARCTTRSIDIDLPGATGRPVVLGLMTDDDSVDVFVSRTVSPRGLPTADAYVRNATVQVLANRQVIGSKGRYVGGGIYRIRREQPFRAGVAYQVRISAPSWGVITSLPDTLPVAVPAQSFVSQPGNYTVSFTDPPGPNYYTLGFELYERNERIFRVSNFIYSFSDETFAGKTYRTTNFIPDYGSRYTANDVELPTWADYTRIRLLSISRQTYLFFEGLNRYDLSKETPDIEPTAPPSGIPGGFGHFGVANSTDVYTQRRK